MAFPTKMMLAVLITSAYTSAPPVAQDETIHALGFVDAADQPRKLSFEVGGVIQGCMIDINQKVEAGQVLMCLSNAQETSAVTVAERKVAMAKAEYDLLLCGTHPDRIASAQKLVDEARPRYDHAVRERRRIESLFKQNAVSQKERDDAEDLVTETLASLESRESAYRHLKQAVRPEDKAVARAYIDLAQAELESAKAALSKTFLKAPIAGTVLEIWKRPGESVGMAGDPNVILLADLEKLTVKAEVDERLVHLVYEGANARVTARGLGDKSFEGKVTSVRGYMGKKQLLSRSPDELRDLDVVQVEISMQPGFRAPLDLRVDVTIGPVQNPP